MLLRTSHIYIRGADACRVLVPKYWTNVSSVSFNFTAFSDSGTGIRSYEWGLGSGPNITNVVAFRPFDGTIEVRSPFVLLLISKYGIELIHLPQLL